MTLNSNDQPLITVAMICYNQENYIAQTIESIISQNYPLLQLVIADDASKDGTVAILRKYEKKYPEIIQIIAHKKNLGINANIDSLFQYIKGRYVCLLGGDDYFLPDKLLKQVAFMEQNPDIIMSYHDVQVCDSQGNVLYNYNNPYYGNRPYSGDIARLLVEKRCFIPALSTMVRTNMASDIRYRIDLPPCADWMYFIELAAKSKVGYLDEQLGCYRRHSGNITNRVDISWEEIIFQKIREFYPDFDDSVNKGLAILYLDYVFKYALVKKWHDSASTLKKLSCQIIKYPLLIGSVLNHFIDMTVRRLALLTKTKKFLR